MKTTKFISPLSKAAIFAKTALLATVALTGSVTSAEAASFTKLDFDLDSNGNAIAPGTIVNGTQYNNQHDPDIGVNPWDGVEIRRKGRARRGITVFNSSCDPNYPGYDDHGNGYADCTGGDTDLATGGSLNTRARGNILIAQDSGRQTIENERFADPGDQGNGSTIIFDFNVDGGVALGNIEFLDFDKTDANKLIFTAKGETGNIIAEYTFSKADGTVTDGDGGTVQNAVRETTVDEEFTGNELTGDSYVTYFKAENGLHSNDKFENSVWDFYFEELQEGVHSLEVNFNGISGGISELSYAKMYENFNTQSQERVPEPGSIAALAFIGGGMFLSRRRMSK